MEKSSVTKQIGIKIREFRKAKRMTQEQLAERVATNPSYIGKLERGEQNVKIQTLEKIAEALEVSTFALFDFDQFEDIRRHDIVWNAISLLLEQSESDQRKALAVLEALFKPY